MPTTTGPYISRITLPDLSSDNYLNNATKTYEIKDTWARDMINTLSGSAINYRGKTKTTLVTGETNPNIRIYTRTLDATGIQETYESYKAVCGDVVLYIDPDKTEELRSSYTVGSETIECLGLSENPSSPYNVLTPLTEGCTTNTITVKQVIGSDPPADSTYNITGKTLLIIKQDTGPTSAITARWYFDGTSWHQLENSLDYTIEFIYDGVSWQEFGSTSEFGELAFKDSASTSYKPAGTVSKPTFTGTAVRLVTSNIPVPTSAAFTGTGVRLVTGNIPVPSAYTSTFSDGSVSVPVSYTPAGSVGTPTISLKTAGSTQNVADKYIMTDLKYGYLLSDIQKADYIHWPNIFVIDESNETLKFEELWFKLVGAISGSNETDHSLNNLGLTRQTYQLKDADGVYQSSKPSWTGTKWETTLTGTATGTVTTTTKSTSNKTATVSPASSGDATYTPSGTIALTNENKTATVSAASSGTTTYTPAGTVSQPTFTGTQATITVQ